MEPLLLHPNESLVYTFDFSGDLPVSVTVISVVVSVPSPMTQTGGSLTGAAYTVLLSGVVHGVTYNVNALATLSNGELVSRTVAIRGYASA